MQIYTRKLITQNLFRLILNNIFQYKSEEVSIILMISREYFSCLIIRGFKTGHFNIGICLLGVEV